MYTIGIIAEYNPFHNGHIYQIKTIRAQYPKARIIALMSGSFTQRGCPAIIDKWQRAKYAILSGVDLVLELPTVFAVRSAQDFARGGISLLTRLGIADGLAFSAESNPSVLKHIAAFIDTGKVQEKLHSYIREGKSYAAALSCALAKISGAKEDIIKQPNNILAIEYLRTLQRNNSSIKPLILQRFGADHHDKDLHEHYASASAIRHEMQKFMPRRERLVQVLPTNIVDSLLYAHKEQLLPKIDLLLRPLLIQLEKERETNIKEIYSINEGLENRLLYAASYCQSMEEMLTLCCSRRYPRSRIQRLIIYLLLQLRQEDIHIFDEAGVLYARILSFNRTGKDMLHEIKRTDTIPLVSKISPFLKHTISESSQQKNTLLANMLKIDVRATELRRLVLPKINARGEDFRQSPIFIRQIP